MKQTIENQFTEPIKQIVSLIKDLDWRPLYLIPSSIVFVALLLVLLTLVVLWPYGVFPIISSFILGLIEDSKAQMKGKTFANAMPYTVAIGIYFLIYFPFFIICLPIYLIGFLGKYFSKSNETIEDKKD
jgi:hypothetical protein